jgi:hypothetical protein
LKKRTFSDSKKKLSQLAKNVGDATALPLMAANDQATTKTAAREGFKLQSVSGYWIEIEVVDITCKPNTHASRQAGHP